MIYRHNDSHTRAARRGIRSFAPCFCSLLVAFAASACATSEDPAEAPPGAAGTGPSLTGTVGRLLESSETCTQPHTICAKLAVPSDMAGTPASIQFVIYDSPDPPTHPPNAYAGLFPSADVTPGETQKFELTDAGLEGNYWLFGIMYMPGGTPFDLPTLGVDYVQMSNALPLPLDGSPLNLETAISLVRAQ